MLNDPECDQERQILRWAQNDKDTNTREISWPK